MLNLAEFERLNESASIEVISTLSPVLVSTLSSVSLAVHSFLAKDSSADRDKLEAERKKASAKIKKLEAAACDNEHRQEIQDILENSVRLNDLLANFSSCVSEADPVRLMELADCARNINAASSTLLKDLKNKRKELRKEDATVRGLFHSILWLSLALSLFVAFLGVFSFWRLLSRPLKQLIDFSTALAQGKTVEAQSGADDEIGDLTQAFEEMAEQLEQKRRIEKAILRNTHDIICTIDSQNRLERINRACEDVLGFNQDSLVRKPILELLPVIDGRSILSNLEDIRKRCSIGSFEAPMLKSNGTTIDVIWSVRWSDQDQLLYCCLHNVDYERKTESISRDLKSLVTEELKQKLARAQGTIRTMDSTGLKLKEKLGNLENSLESTIKLLDKLGDALSSKSTDLSLQKEFVKTAELLARSVAVVAELAEKNVLTLTTDSEEIDLHVDALQIERVLVNLLSNAIKVSPPEGEIMVRAKISDSGDMVRFDVQDSGPGIALNRQHLLFEPFSQIERVESLEGKGSGLGLFSAKSIVGELGGRMGVVSDGKTGSIIWFELPVVSL